MGSQGLYSRLPVWLQHVAVSAYGLQWKRRRYGGVFERELRGFKEREAFTAEQWRAYQTTELRTLLLHAFATVPYYRRVYSAAGFQEHHFRTFSLENLRDLPFLEKEDLRRFGRTELLSSRRERGGEFFASSGSTGTPTSILFSVPFHQCWSAAFEARIRHWAGVDRHMARGMIGGRRVVTSGDAEPPFYRYNFFEKQTYFSAYHISRRTAANYVAGMRKFGVQYMTGYAMSNFLLANFIDQLGLEAPRLRAVVTSSEKLTPAMRDVLSKVYGCATYDSYSGVEACALISQDRAGELAVSPDVGIVELLDSDGAPAIPGEPAEMVQTGLLNRDQPLIRYRIGDLARGAQHAGSAAGHEMPIVEDIIGRIEDRVVGPDGRVMVRFHGLFVNVPHLVSAQVVQESIDRIRINVVTEPGFSGREEKTIADRVRSQLGAVDVEFAAVDEFEKNANGKVQAVISKVTQAPV